MTPTVHIVGRQPSYVLSSSSCSPQWVVARAAGRRARLAGWAALLRGVSAGRPTTVANLEQPCRAEQTGGWVAQADPANEFTHPAYW